MRFWVVSQAAVLWTGTPRASGRRERELASTTLAVPGKTVFLLPLIYRVTKQLLEHVEVDLSLCEGFGEQGFQLVEVLGEQVSRFGFRGRWR